MPAEPGFTPWGTGVRPGEKCAESGETVGRGGDETIAHSGELRVGPLGKVVSESGRLGLAAAPRAPAPPRRETSKPWLRAARVPGCPQTPWGPRPSLRAGRPGLSTAGQQDPPTRSPGLYLSAGCPEPAARPPAGRALGPCSCRGAQTARALRAAPRPRHQAPALTTPLTLPRALDHPTRDPDSGPPCQAPPPRPDSRPHPDPRPQSSGTRPHPRSRPGRQAPPRLWPCLSTPG